MAYKDLTGQKFGELTVIEYAFTKNKRAYWKCKCSCGKELIKIGKNLSNGQDTHCGCLTKIHLSESRISKKDYTGQKFGKLTVIEKLPHYKRNRTYYRCLCECGNETILPSGSLGENGTKSCGCLVAELKRKDVSNQKFGKLLAIRPLYSDPKTQGIVWECKCDCGKTINLLISKLTSGNTKSCGCSKHIAHNLTDLTGNTYGKLKVVRYAYTKNNARYWECLCECGNTSFVSTNCLTQGHTKSCGCSHHQPAANRSIIWLIRLGYMQFGKKCVRDVITPKIKIIINMVLVV